jgi:hypothetical protein
MELLSKTTTVAEAEPAALISRPDRVAQIAVLASEDILLLLGLRDM